MRRTHFTEEHDLFRESFRTFVEREIAPHDLEWNDAGIVPRELFAKAGAAGFLGMAVPEEFGGGGVDDFRYSQVIGEELQYAGVGRRRARPHAAHRHLPPLLPLARHRRAEARAGCPGIASGELITAIAMTEPGIGSDLASMSTSAIRDGDHYVVNGAKTFITNGINADLVITAVKTDPTQRHAGMSLLVIERGMDGFERGRNLEKVGLHAQDTAELFFTDVQVPVDEPARRRGQGLRAPRRQPAAGAALDRGERRRRGRGRVPAGRSTT